MYQKFRKGNLVRIKNRSKQASELSSPIDASYSKNASVDYTTQDLAKSQGNNSLRDKSIEFDNPTDGENVKASLMKRFY